MAYLINGEMVKGGSVDVVETMATLVYDSDRFASLDAYMEWFSSNAWRLYGKGVTYGGPTIEERCASFVSSLVENSIIEAR